MDFWPEFLASSWGGEFLAGGFGGVAGVVSGYPLDTLRIQQQQVKSGSALGIFRRIIGNEGPSALYRGMAAPLASVTIQNAMVFQSYAILSRAFDASVPRQDPPSYRGVALGGVGAGALQSLLLSPIELVKIRLQLQDRAQTYTKSCRPHQRDIGPMSIARSVLAREGLRGLYRGLTVTVLRDAPSHGVYFWTYEYMREQLHPGCRKNGQESFRTMLVAGGLAGVFSWICCYPLDVVKTRMQAQSRFSPGKYSGTIDCLCRIVKEEGHAVLWRGVGTTVARAFLVNGAVFTAYEIALRCFFHNSSGISMQGENAIWEN